MMHNSEGRNFFRLAHHGALD